MRVYCNPVNVPYAYQFKKDPRDRYKMTVNREAADPSMVMFQGKYYLFASMTGSVWVSEDMAHWDSYPLPENMPIYDALAKKYLNINCSVMSPNNSRMQYIDEMIDEYQVDGVIEIILQACHTYNIESHYVKQTVTNKGKSYLMIETDYSQADKGQIRTRLEAFLETLEK